jgi:hypothetical protein
VAGQGKEATNLPDLGSWMSVKQATEPTDRELRKGAPTAAVRTLEAQQARRPLSALPHRLHDMPLFEEATGMGMLSEVLNAKGRDASSRERFRK